MSPSSKNIFYSILLTVLTILKAESPTFLLYSVFHWNIDTLRCHGYNSGNKQDITKYIQWRVILIECCLYNSMERTVGPYQFLENLIILWHPISFRNILLLILWINRSLRLVVKVWFLQVQKTLFLSSNEIVGNGTTLMAIVIIMENGLQNVLKPPFCILLATDLPFGIYM